MTLNIKSSTPSDPILKQSFSEGSHKSNTLEKYTLAKNFTPWMAFVSDFARQNGKNIKF